MCCFSSCMLSRQITDINRMFNMFRGTPSVGVTALKPAVDQMVKTFQKFIEETGGVIVQKLKLQRVAPEDGEEGLNIMWWQ